MVKDDNMNIVLKFLKNNLDGVYKILGLPIWSS